jgi:uncharacterized protein YbjT (DUF2867 family)
MYVITGATGHTGSIAAKTLLSRGHKVRALGRSIDRLRSLASAGAEPFACEVTDAKKLTEAFQGAQAVYVMVPPNLTANDVRGYQEQVTDAIANAVSKANVPAVVSLSSLGADKADKTGPVVGLHNLEEKLNRVNGTNVLHIRAGYFMENTLPQAGAIRAMGKGAGPLRPDLKLSMIATRDIGAAVAEALIQLDFKGKQTRELQGQRDLTMVEATKIIGAAIGQLDLQYVQLPDDQVRGFMLQLGMSKNFVDLLLEMVQALNSGYMRALEPRSSRNTTPTTFEQFVQETFVPSFKQETAAA